MQKLPRIGKLKFHEQPLGSGACGKYSTQNALVFLGIETTQDVLDRLTKVSRYKTARYGLTQHDIRNALAALNLKPKFCTHKTIEKAKIEINKVLMKSPIIASVDNGSHWAVIGRRSGKYYYIADSARRPVLSKKTWNQIANWIMDERGIFYIRVTTI